MLDKLIIVASIPNAALEALKTSLNFCGFNETV